jgi:tRNA threonylcarbamoyl adenosine modification protein YjeE
MTAKRNAAGQSVETLDLGDEGETVALARWLAGFARAGDFIGLRGDFGAGKTAFARAYLRALTGDPELEAPSPTFTLIQSYDGPDFPVVHADFHRLRGAEELAQLGWDETIEGAVALVEWPELAAAALPADRLEIAFSYDPARGGEFRHVEFIARGAMAARFKLARAIESLLAGAGWAEARREPLHGDASTRAFERLTTPDGQSAILMISPPRAGGPTLRFGKTYPEIAKLSGDIRAFVAMADGLRSLGFSTPRIQALSLADGLALIEDFGDDTIAEGGAPNAPRYAEAISLIADLHRRDLPTQLPVDGETYVVSVYDIEAMLIEVELALDWYAPAIARGNPSSGARIQFLGLWRDILTPVLAQPTTWTLRDFHSPNLHWLPGRDGLKRLGLIDFQDAVLGPPAYDVASLLQDARVAIPDDLELRLLAHYARRRASADPDFDANAFAAAYSIMGAQRATKILGLFTRLDRRDGKPQYLEHLPRIERTLAKNLKHPSLELLRLWYETHLPRALGPSSPSAELR